MSFLSALTKFDPSQLQDAFERLAADHRAFIERTDTGLVNLADWMNLVQNTAVEQSTITNAKIDAILTRQQRISDDLIALRRQLENMPSKSVRACVVIDMAGNYGFVQFGKNNPTIAIDEPLPTGSGVYVMPVSTEQIDSGAVDEWISRAVDTGLDVITHRKME